MAGCSDDPTQLLVVVDSDMQVPKPLSIVSAEIRDEAGAVIGTHEFLLTGSMPTKLPFSFGVLAPAEDLEALVTVEVSAVESATATRPLFTRVAVTRFLENKSLILPMFLASNCQSLMCGEEQTCTENGCVSTFVEPTRLKERRGTPSDLIIRVNQSTPDAGQVMDASEVADARFDAESPMDAVVVDTGESLDSGVFEDAAAPDVGFGMDSGIFVQTASVAMNWVYSAPAGLYFSQSEVTMSQYAACVTAGACNAGGIRTTLDEAACNFDNATRGDHPMNCLTWTASDEYCTWVNARLPSEDDWYAEASNNGARIYPWGDTPVATCNNSVINDSNFAPGAGCGLGATSPVCSKPLGNSISGLCDMTGNVIEWTSTHTVQDGRILKNGHWLSLVTEQKYLVNTYPYRLGANSNISYGGFRCVRDTAP